MAHETFKAKGVGFYRDIIGKLIARGQVTREMSVLVVCGGGRDQEVLADAGFANVTISNLDSRMTGNEFAPYAWSFQDAESLSFPDNTFDVVLVHAGLHHCRSPHRALLEMYRVARRGVLVFESRDNILLKATSVFGFSKDYEIEAVVGNGYAFGGVANSAIPNFVYRWTEREVEKTIQSFAPEAPHRIGFFYGLRMPYQRLQMRRARALLLLARCLEPPIGLATLVFPKLANEFGFFVQKPELPADLHPWLALQGGEVAIDREWAERRYRG